jgi:hypothetical protein
LKLDIESIGSTLIKPSGSNGFELACITNIASSTNTAKISWYKDDAKIKDTNMFKIYAKHDDKQLISYLKFELDRADSMSGYIDGVYTCRLDISPDGVGGNEFWSEPSFVKFQQTSKNQPNGLYKVSRVYFYNSLFRL